MRFFGDDQNDYSHVTTVRLINSVKSTMAKKVIDPEISYAKERVFTKPSA